MYLLGFDLPVWAVLLFTTATITYYFAKKNRDYFSDIGVSGPRAWPFIGNLFEIVTTPLPTFCSKHFERHGKVFGIFFGLTPTLNVADVEFIREITMKQFSKFPDRRSSAAISSGAFVGNLLSLKGEHWKHVRSQLTGTFTSGKLKQMQTLIDQNVDNLIENLTEKSGQEVVIKDFTGAYTLDVVASTAFGILLDSQKDSDEPLLKHVKSMFAGINLRNPRIIISLFYPAFGRFLVRCGIPTFNRTTTDYFAATVKQQLESATDQETARNFIHICSEKLVEISNSNPEDVRVSNGQKWSVKGLTEIEILSNGLIFFLAGYDTTAILLQFALYALAQNPEVQQKLRDELTEVSGNRVASYEELGKMEYMDWVINETLRITNRTCVEDAEVKGIRIPKGTTINLCIHHVHHDPENWEDPETFKPERFDPANRPENFQYIFLPFGAGPRNCIGMRLALLEAKAALARIIQHFDVDVTETTPLAPLELVKGTTIYRTVLPITLKLSRRPDHD